MKLEEGFTRHSLAAMGAEACALLCKGDIATLVERYGYAFARGVAPESAIREDLARSLAGIGATALGAAPPVSECIVELFAPNGSKLIGDVTCAVPTDNGSVVFVDLIVAQDQAEYYIMLEEIRAGA